MKLNEEQKKIAENLRDCYDITDFRAVGTALTFSEVLALMIDGVTKGIHPGNMQRHFSLAWKCYVKIVGDEHKALLENVLGDKFREIQEHPEAGKIFSQIYNRITEQCGPIIPGMESNLDDIDIDDILEELEI